MYKKIPELVARGSMGFGVIAICSCSQLNLAHCIPLFVDCFWWCLLGLDLYASEIWQDEAFLSCTIFHGRLLCRYTPTSGILRTDENPRCQYSIKRPLCTRKRYMLSNGSICFIIDNIGQFATAGDKVACLRRLSFLPAIGFEQGAQCPLRYSVF